MSGVFLVVAAFLIAFFIPQPAYAIPSPDLIAGSLSSLSQIAMLVSAAIGGLAFTGTRFTTRGRGAAPSGPQRRIVLWTALAVLALSVGANLYQYLSRSDARLALYQSTLVRPSHNPGQTVLDPTLHEESYSEQLKDPNGISTQDLADLLQAADKGGAKNTNLLDVRETGETKLGEVKHFTAIRWPDLASSGVDMAQHRNVLVCQNGNRSSETCAALVKQGIPCNFVRGGLEKWIAEGHEMSASQLRSPDQLRGVPAYRNDGVFLATAQVHKLVDHDHAVVLDTRYPGEFANNHIPGAINIPIRSLPSDVLHKRIAAVPKRPVVLACYDRRSCFMSAVLGQELSQAGYDIRGRYTLPWEYFIATPEASYVKAWRQRIAASFWTKASRQLGHGVGWLADRGLGLPLAIILLAIVSRLLVLPVSLKAERDQAKIHELTDEIAALKARLGGDGRRFSRALTALHRRHGMTPGRNMLALAFLPVLALSVAAVNAVSIARPQSLWWIPNLAHRDPYLLMPAIFSVLVTLYLVVSVARTRKQKLVSLVIGFPVFTGLAYYLSAGADLYMVASACLMLLQRAIISVDFAKLREARVLRRARDGGMIGLGEAHLLPDCGNKAKRLGVMLDQGLVVPDGLVLTPAFLAKLRTAPAAAARRQLDQVWRRLKATEIAVRSSASAEDGATRSFAGVFESVLHVDRAGLAQAIAKVEASFTAHTQTYGEGGAGNIVLQPMIDAQYAGVLFTEAPASFGLMMIEMVEGTADAFVSGAAAPSTYLLGRHTGRLTGEATAPIDLAPLVALGRRIETIFGAPQDIEWAYCGGRYYLLQSRDITRSQLDGEAARRERERARVLERAATGEDGIAFAQTELSELLPRPTPLSLDLMQSLWQAGGSVDLACRMLRMRYSADDESRPYLLSIFGRLYVDQREEHERALRVGPLAAMQLRRAAEAIEKEYDTQFLPELAERVHLLEAVDFDRLAIKDLQRVLEDVRADYVGNTCAQVEVINIVAQFYLEKAKTEMESRGLDAARHLGGIPDTPMARAMAAAAEHPAGDARIDAFLATFGHRAPLDYELAQSRYYEDRAQVAALVAGVDSPSQLHGRTARPAMEPGWDDRGLKTLVERARRFQTLKEDAKHQTLRQLAVVRRVLVALDERFGFNGEIFQLTFAEIAEIGESAAIARARALIAGRLSEAASFAQVPPLPAELDVATLETVPLTEVQAATTGDGMLAGTLVSGGAPVTGRAFLVSLADAENGAPLRDFVDGDIIVSRMMHPAWLPYFGRAGALVCEIGGWLSHVAILARECEVPMVVGVHGLTAIETGEPLCVHADGHIERLALAEEAEPLRSSIA